MHSSFHRDLQLKNLEVIVADISTFDMDAAYDRIFSIGMFEVFKFFILLFPKESHDVYCWIGFKNLFCSLKTAYEELQGSS